LTGEAAGEEVEEAVRNARIIFALGAMLAVRPAYADCPDGGRTTTPGERQDYVETTAAIRSALPQPPAGWRVVDRLGNRPVTAPENVCKGAPLVPGYYVTYVWTEQEKRVGENTSRQNARLRALGLLTPDEQKEVDELGRQARELERKAVAVVRTDPDEAAHLRAQARPFSEQANAIRKKHLEAVQPQMDAIRTENVAGITGVGTEVAVSITVSKADAIGLATAERLQIPGASSALYDGKELVMLLGGDAGRKVWIRANGTRHEAETIAALMAGSTLGTVTANPNRK
jgi:hypothetical protein